MLYEYYIRGGVVVREERMGWRVSRLITTTLTYICLSMVRLDDLFFLVYSLLKHCS